MDAVKLLQKWNFVTREYEYYPVPAEWETVVIADLDKEVNCAGCGKKLRYGECYCSTQIHTEFTGFGYAVCRDCYRKEWRERAAAEGRIEK